MKDLKWKVFEAQILDAYIKGQNMTLAIDPRDIKRTRKILEKHIRPEDLCIVDLREPDPQIPEEHPQVLAVVLPRKVRSSWEADQILKKYGLR